MPNQNGTYYIRARVTQPTIITKNTSVTTNNDMLTYQFTRHAPSCNNINFGKFYAKNKDFEPGIVWLGIIKIINLMMSKHEEQYEKSFETYKSNVVCVSNLYRTWCTAFLMHGPNKPTILNIIVCPYLKEYHNNIQRGNYPKDVRHTFFKFLKFLTSLHDVFVHTSTNTSEKTRLFQKMVEYNSSSEDSEDKLEENPQFYKGWYESLPMTITFYLLSADVRNTPYIISIKKDSADGVYKFVDVINNASEFCKMKQILGADLRKIKFKSLQVEGYTKTGNLQQFMQWYYDNEELIITATNRRLTRKHFNNTLSVVTHSHIMEDYIKKTWGLRGTTLTKYEQVEKHNSWSFQVKNKLNEKNQLVITDGYDFTPTPGVLVTDKGVEQKKAIEIERIMQRFSLCGKNGSVKNECLSSAESSLNDNDDGNDEVEVSHKTSLTQKLFGLSRGSKPTSHIHPESFEPAVGGLLRTKKMKYKKNTRKNKIIKIRSKKLH
jgi:hypothetical protein